MVRVTSPSVSARGLKVTNNACAALIRACVSIPTWAALINHVSCDFAGPRAEGRKMEKACRLKLLVAFQTTKCFLVRVPMLYLT